MKSGENNWVHLLQKEIKLAPCEIIIAFHFIDHTQKLRSFLPSYLPGYFITFQCLLQNNRLCFHEKKVSQPLISSFYYVFACSGKSIGKGNCSGLAGYTKSSSRDQGVQGWTGPCMWNRLHCFKDWKAAVVGGQMQGLNMEPEAVRSRLSAWANLWQALANLLELVCGKLSLKSQGHRWS